MLCVSAVYCARQQSMLRLQCLHVRSVVMNTIAVLPHLKKQPTAYLINVTSGV